VAPRSVLFDFDGTLTRRDTFFAYCMAIARRQEHPVRAMFRVACSMALVKARLITNHQLKERTAAVLLTGEKESHIARIMQEEGGERLAGKLDTEMVGLLERMREAGANVFLVSSSLDCFLRPFGPAWGLRGIIATRTEVIDGRFTGRLIGRTCNGPEKVARVIEEVGEREARESVAYGDSRGDEDLLNFVAEGYRVRRRLTPGPSRIERVVTGGRAVRDERRGGN